MTAKKISELTAATEAQIYNDIVLPIVSGGATLKAAARSDLFWALVPDGAGVHNGIYRGKDITADHLSGAMSANIANGTFRNIFIGDYIEMEMTSEFGTEKVRWLVAAINYFKHRTDVDITQNHIVLVAEDCFKDFQKMNSSNTTTGGFAGSEMYTTTLPKYDTAITNAFGSKHVLSYHQLLTTSTNTTTPSMAGANFVGCSNNWAWANGSDSNPHVTKLNLMSEPQLYGTKVYSSSFYDIGINNSQFPLFVQIPEKIRCGRGFNAFANARSFFCLSSVVSTTSFAVCASYGEASLNGASGSSGVRPYFLYK